MSALVAALERTSHALNEATHKLDAMATEIADSESEIRTLEKNLAGAVDVLSFVLRGIEYGHIKCAPYFDFDPDADQIEFKTVADRIREAIIKFGSV